MSAGKTEQALRADDQLVPQVSGSGILQTLGIPKHQFTLVATQRIKRFWVNLDFVATSNSIELLVRGDVFFDFGPSSRMRDLAECGSYDYFKILRVGR